MSTLASTAICLIACHAGPADHFATYAEMLKEKGYEVQVHATGPAIKKFQDRNIKFTPFFIENLSDIDRNYLAHEIAKVCSTVSFILTDLGHEFSAEIQKALAIEAANTLRFAYYDNQEPFVPGGYSITAAKVIQATQGILFANANLAAVPIYSEPGKEIDVTGKTRVGLGYYPLTQVEDLAKRRRTEHQEMRQIFLAKHGIEDKGQKLFVYFGGNNEEYFSKAFPAFLNLIKAVSEQEDLSHIIFVIQQHPGAKASKRDEKRLCEWMIALSEKAKTPKIILSDTSTDDAQVMADAAFYYQTSMGPQFILEGIPVVQIGHDIYEDILIKNKLAPSVTTPTQLLQTIQHLQQNQQSNSKEAVLKSLGIRADWEEILEKTIKQKSSQLK